MALRYGGLINITNCLGNTALHFCYEYRHHALAKYLESKGANYMISNIKGQYAKDGIKKGHYAPSRAEWKKEYEERVKAKKLMM